MPKSPKKGPPAPKPANPSTPATPPGGANAYVLDTSSAGMPSLPTAQGANTGIASGAPPAGPNDELIIEVELAPGAASLGSALVTDTNAFVSGSAAPSTASDSALSGVLRKYGVREARHVFTAEQVQAETARLAELRRSAAVGAASTEQVSALERLPALSSFVRLRFPPGTPASEVNGALKRLPEVTRAVVVPRAIPPILAASKPFPADPLIGTGSGPLVPDPVTQLESQWYLHRTRVREAWRFTRGAGVVVADIDWGFRTSHQEFQPGFDVTYNAVDGGEDVTQGASAAHGTGVMGIAAARSNGFGMAGYAPEASLWAIQADSAPGAQRFEEPWAEAIDFVRRTNAAGRRKVIILEVQTGQFGNYEQVPSVHRAIRAAIADGCVVCVAAGNGDRRADLTDQGEPFEPTGSILVGATAYDPALNKRAWFSNFGTRVTVSAPGDSNHDLTCGQISDSAYRNGFGGTSGATPKVAGTVALMLSVNPGLTHEDTRSILTGTGSPLVEDPGKPIGVFLNAESAVAEALRRRSETLPDEARLSPQGEPVSEPAAAKPLQGVRRRVSQMVLPRDVSSPIFWDTPPATASAEMAAIPRAEQAPPGDRTLRVFRETVEGTLTQQDRILIVGQAIQMLDNFYVHRPLKEAVHAVRPIQRLRVLQRRLQGIEILPAERDELAFHNTLTQIFTSVRDLHTSYQLPSPFREFIAYLPFEVASFYEDGRRRYLVTRTMPGYIFEQPAEDASFGPGVELLYWNGMAIDRAVKANADQTAGSNDAARHARGVSALTIRPMNTALPPDADFVDLEFVPVGADASDPTARTKLRQQWFVRYAPTTQGAREAVISAAANDDAPPPASPAPPGGPQSASISLDLGREQTSRASEVLFDLAPSMAGPAPAAPPQSAPAAASAANNIRLAAVLGLDNAADAVREARQLIFDSEALRDLERANVGDVAAGVRASASAGSAADNLTVKEIDVSVPWNFIFRARTCSLNGQVYGHIHIRTFYVRDPDGFVSEFIRLLGEIPDRGLILDVRGNGGGNILAAECLLQTMTARTIEPERLQFVVTPGTLDLARNNPDSSQIPLDVWRPSLEEAVETGAMYSHAFPLTSPKSCNEIGQRYYGPVVLIVDGNCYSATDMFAAGFQDHKIGKILGVSANTGAGGANVWEHWLLNEALPPGWGLKPLPNKASMRVAIRQCLRVGPRAGALLEDFGVVPDTVHQPSRVDVLEGDKDLFARAAELLAEQMPLSIKVTMGDENPEARGKRRMTVDTRGLKRIDFYVNHRPQGSIDFSPDATGAAQLMPSIEIGARLRLAGFVEPTDLEAAAVYLGIVP